MKPFLTVCLICLMGLSSVRADKWEVWENCRWMPDKANDGDSFKVRKEKGRYTYILRLYFVDAAETDRSLEQRIKDQAEYWGITEDEVYKLGKMGTKFTEKFLKDGFTVYTKKEKAMGRSAKNRYYALVEVDGVFLNNALMQEGLARFHGAQTDMPDDLPSRSRFRLRLKGSEKDAQAAKKGGWGMAAASSTGLPQAPPSIFAPKEPQHPDDVELPNRLTLRFSVAVYSTQDTNRQVGTLTPGIDVILLREFDDVFHRVRFTTRANKTYEALIKTSDLLIQ